MRYIVLSDNGLPVLYEAPDEIAERLSHYADLFLESVHDPGSGYWVRMADPSGGTYDCLSYSLRDFIDWLNKKKLTRGCPVREAETVSKEERVLILETAEREKHLPRDRQQYPSFYF